MNDSAFEAAMEIIQFCQVHEDGSFKILICGESKEIDKCLDSVLSTFGNSVDKRLIAAADHAGPLINKYFGVNGIHIAEWSEEIYEEYLIERVSPREDPWPIRVIVDFSPSLRRLHRIFKISGHNSLVLLNHVDNRWLKIFPALFTAFVEKNSVIKTFCDSNAAGERRTPYNHSFGELHIFK